MGVVYRARQISLNRIVALKFILSGPFATKQEFAHFRGEAEAAANLCHPNIVPIYEIGEHQGQHFFSMEYVQGRDLGAIVRDRSLAPNIAARYTEAIARAIHYAHRHGILHRDLKPSNVLIDENDQAQITDFGLAKRLG
jgi:serine/threonine-protein kinase